MLQDFVEGYFSINKHAKKDKDQMFIYIWGKLVTNVNFFFYYNNTHLQAKTVKVQTG